MKTESLLFLAALAACSTEPVGGRGPFDPVYDPLPENFSPAVTSPAGATPPAAPGAQLQTADARGSDQVSDQVSDQLSDQLDVFRAEIEAALNVNGVPVITSPGASSAQAGGVLPGPDEIGIDPNAEEINLSLSSQEQQKIEREAAARRLEAVRAQRVEIAPEELPEQDVTANVVRFARTTTHAVGQRQHSRNPLISRSQSRQTCRRFASVDDAQRQFLANGGPERDPFNLDPDGDGFACGFDPEVYRKLQF